MRTGRGKPPSTRAHSDDEGATWSQGPAPSRWQYSRWGKWRGHRGRRPGPDRDARRHPGGQLRTQARLQGRWDLRGLQPGPGATPGPRWTRLAMGHHRGPTPTVREISPGKLFVVYDKRDEYYTSPSRRIYGRTIDVKTTVNSGRQSAGLSRRTYWDAVAPVVRQRLRNASGRRRGLDGASRAIWRLNNERTKIPSGQAPRRGGALPRDADRHARRRRVQCCARRARRGTPQLSY